MLINCALMPQGLSHIFHVNQYVYSFQQHPKLEWFSQFYQIHIPSSPNILCRAILFWKMKLCLIKWNATGKKYWTHEEREVQKGIESQDSSWNLSVIRKQSCPLSVEINISWFRNNPSRFEDCLCGRVGQNHTWAMHGTTVVSPYRRRLEAVITNKGFCTKYYINFSSSILFPCVIPFYCTCLHFLTYLFCFLCMYGLLGLLSTSGVNFMSTTPLEMYLLRKLMLIN